MTPEDRARLLAEYLDTKSAYERLVEKCAFVRDRSDLPRLREARDQVGARMDVLKAAADEGCA
jgi:hypothetical protein